MSIWVELKTPPAGTKDTRCNPERFRFPAVKKRQVAASFSGGDVTSDGGLAQNPRRLAPAKPLIASAEQAFQTRQEKQRHFGGVQYAAAAWDHERRGIVKAEHTANGSNPRFLVTNLADGAQKLYAEVYCAPGEMENRIQEQQLGLFADRTSCHGWLANQFRLLLSSFA